MSRTGDRDRTAVDKKGETEWRQRRCCSGLRVLWDRERPL